MFVFFFRTKMASKASKRAVEEDLANVEFETSEDVEVNIFRTIFIFISGGN